MPSTYKHLAGVGTMLLSPAPTRIQSVTINSPASLGTLTIYDDPSGVGVGPVIAVINAATAGGMFGLEVQAQTGLTVVSTGPSGDYTFAIG